MTRRRLPIGIQTFRRLRERDCYYVDKYRDRGLPIHLIAVEFSSEARNLASFSVERA